MQSSTHAVPPTAPVPAVKHLSGAKNNIKPTHHKPAQPTSHAAAASTQAALNAAAQATVVATATLPTAQPEELALEALDLHEERKAKVQAMLIGWDKFA